VRRMSLEHRRTSWGHRLAGTLYRQTQRWEMASQEYLEALAIDATQPGLHADLGGVYLHDAKPAEASAEFRKELARDPGDEQARLGLAELHLAVGEVDAAREQIDQIWKRSPEFLAVQADFPDIEPGRDLAQRLIASFPHGSESGSSHLLLAALFRIAGDSSKAHEHQIALARIIRDREQEQSRTAHESAELLCRTRRYAACAQALASAVRLDVAGYLSLGKARLVLRQFEAAADAFAASLALVANNAEVIYRLARSYQVLADECFRRMEELAPDSWRTHQMRAEFYKLRYDDPQAMQEYERAIQLRPDTAELYEELGALYLQNNSREQGRSALEKALKLEPSRARALYLLGQLYANAGEQNKAIQYFQKALRYDANLLEARATLGKAYMRVGKPEAAIAELQKALAFDFYGDMHYMLYRAYRDLGKTELAREALRRSAEMRKNSVARDRDKLERWMKN
jgi:tetratricopeptide (TPR) repeat protein